MLKVLVIFWDDGLNRIYKENKFISLDYDMFIGFYMLKLY